MGRTPRSLEVTETHRALIARLVASRYLNKSARLQELLLYLTERVLEHEVDEIHEQEVGSRVFGRSANYDTATDNIVRVHASMLRKRLEQYFSQEGTGEPVILELPKGNYAPIFYKRPEPEPPSPVLLEPHILTEQPRRWAVRVLAVLLATSVCSTAWLLWRRPANVTRQARPTVDLFWSQVFRPDRPVDIVLDDAAVGLYQDLTGRSLTLSEYFDRDYLRRLPGTAAAASIDERLASSVVLRRHTSYSSVSFLWKLAESAPPDYRRATLHFAREYSFRDLKANNALLVGNSRTNLWIEPFEQKLGLRWEYDSSAEVFVPKDVWNSVKTIPPATVAIGTTEPHEGYFGVALVPNLSSTGTVLIVSGTGGSAMNSAMDFLSNEASVLELRRKLPGSAREFPKFEALIRVTGRSKLPKDAIVVICRELRG